MRMPKYDPNTYRAEQSYSAKQLSRYDMQVAGIVIYVVAMTVFFVIALVMMLFWNENATQARAQRRAETRSASAESRNRLAELTQPLPKPALRPEDTNDDIAVLHAREDLMLENFTWADREHERVRIPIERAMSLVALRGLPTVAPATSSTPLLTGDTSVAIAAPLTSGFARTENEQVRRHD